MKLIEILQSIKTIALRNPFVKSAYIGDIYSILNPTAEIKYSVVTVDITELSRDDIGANYTVVLNYADRTLQDNSNVKEIQSDAFSCLTSIINDITESLEGETDNFTLSTFEQKFNDYCAGASAQFQLTLSSEMGDCDINDDYDPIEREIDITENGTYDVTDYNIANVNVEPSLKHLQTELSLDKLDGSFTLFPDPGYDGFSMVNATYHVASTVKTVDIDTNGEYVYTGRDEAALKEITVRVNVPSVEAVEITQAEYDALTEYDDYKIYLIID